MRITRTGLALSLVLAIGCSRQESAPTPATESPPAPEASPSPAAPQFFKPEEWFADFRFVREPEAALERLPEPPRIRTAVRPDPASAISAVVAANGDLVPASGEELIDALKSVGDFVQLPVSFSAVALDSGLTRPRVVLAARDNAPFVNRPNMFGRLFLAANMTIDRPGDPPRVKAIEFISWNSRRLKFDFGVIENVGGEPELKFLDGVRCFTCHKNHGPILGVKPWSNTAHNAPVAEATAIRFGLKKKEQLATIDGIAFGHANAEDVDRIVRFAADSLLERSTVQVLAKSPVGRTALARIMLAISLPGELTALDTRTVEILNHADLRRFAYDAFMIQKTSASSKLIDPDPQGLLGPSAGGITWWGGLTPQHFLDFDALRAAGEHRTNVKFAPSNPHAFEKRPFKAVARASDAIDPAMVARVIGLTPSDRRFLAETLADAAASASRWDTWPVAPRDLAEKIFSGPQFKTMLESGAIPDRDEFKDRFIAALAEALRANGYSGKYWMSRERYASTAVIAAGTNREASEVLPTTACLRCHDIAKPGVKPAFNPIPPLAFDPFDPVGREVWLKSADPARRAAVLNRMLKRLGRDRDMPPTDSAEHEMFREKNPESFRAATEFLDRALNRR